MKFCIPTAGALFVLTEDFVIKDIQDKNCNLYLLSAFKDCPQKRKTVTNTWSKRPYDEINILQGSFTFPKGTVFKVDSISMYTQKAKASWRHRHDAVSLKIIETPLEYYVDSQIVKTKSGRISKQKKSRPEVTLNITPEMFNSISFEYTI